MKFKMLPVFLIGISLMGDIEVPPPDRTVAKQPDRTSSSTIHSVLPYTCIIKGNRSPG